ncbi:MULTISPECIES: hypothetical protein [Bacillus]|uniref:hypothetical protein n=1 Tax=Bacillus TaxID=1386 RepID=UPI0011A01DDC|nr:MULTISPECIES: hypothetical protein [Bacillus]MBU8728379.1 hypothetical protein [Bacillus pumilus]MCP1148225.1 hypothetical protein [Bacillus sp. 1735sda2]
MFGNKIWQNDEQRLSVEGGKIPAQFILYMLKVLYIHSFKHILHITCAGGAIGINGQRRKEIH